VKIAVGSVFEEYGGVSAHIFNIQRFSSHTIEVVPSSFTRNIIYARRSIKPYYKRFLEKKHLVGFDVVHSHTDPWFEKLCYSSRSNDCKWVHTYHTLFFDEDYRDGLNEWQMDINRSLLEVASKADLKISVSKWMQKYLFENYSIETVVVENGIDLEACNKAKGDRFTKKYGLSDFVLFVGGIREVKNPLLFIKLAEEMPDMKFVMIGEKLDESNIIEKYGVSLPKNLVLLGTLKHVEVLDAMAACRIYVVTSKREATPITLLEAMAMKKNVVVPLHTGCVEVVPSDGYGFLYNLDSFEELVARTKDALSAERINVKARERIKEKYDWRKLAKKLDSLYESIG